MNALNALRFLNKSFSARAKIMVSSLKCFQRNYKPRQTSSFDLKSHTKQDVVLFRYENMKFFVIVNIISAIHCLFWTQLGCFLYRSLDKDIFNIGAEKFWGKVLQKERQYSTVLSAVSLFFGWIIFIGCGFYTTRSIRKIILHKNGTHITFVTYNLPGYNTTKIPLNNLSSADHRKDVKKFLPLKIKNKYFYYLVDMRGEFSNPTLFDFTVGVRRGF